MNLAGIPIRLHWSFAVLFAGASIYSLFSGGISSLFSTVLLGTALFSSVVLHELGHALAARYFGIETDNITLYPFGGIASIRGMPRSPKQEFVIAAAGPAVNAVLFFSASLFWGLIGGQIVLTFAALNFVMGVFNLIPAFPMDGGRILRAVLSTQLGWFRASEVAMQIGKGFAWLFVGVGFFWWTPSLLLVGMFLHVAIATEWKRMMWEYAYSRKSRHY